MPRCGDCTVMQAGSNPGVVWLRQQTHKNKFLLECGRKALNNTQLRRPGAVCLLPFLHTAPLQRIYAVVEYVDTAGKRASADWFVSYRLSFGAND